MTLFGDFGEAIKPRVKINIDPVKETEKSVM